MQVISAIIFMTWGAIWQFSLLTLGVCVFVFFSFKFHHPKIILTINVSMYIYTYIQFCKKCQIFIGQGKTVIL